MAVVEVGTGTARHRGIVHVARPVNGGEELGVGHLARGAGGPSMPLIPKANCTVDPIRKALALADALRRTKNLLLFLLLLVGLERWHGVVVHERPVESLSRSLLERQGMPVPNA